MCVCQQVNADSTSISPALSQVDSQQVSAPASKISSSGSLESTPAGSTDSSSEALSKVSADTSVEVTKEDSWDSALSDSTLVSPGGDSTKGLSSGDTGISHLDSTVSGDSLTSLSDSSTSIIPAASTLLKEPVDITTDSAAAQKLQRQIAVRETRINTIDQFKGKYKSPKKALFMSLLAPGLGQAYLGSYYRASAYVIAEAGLWSGWHYYVNVKHDRQVRRYRRYADANWSHAAYEDSIVSMFSTQGPDIILKANQTRESFCQIFKAGDVQKTCKEFSDDYNTDYKNLPHYGYSRYDYRDSVWNIDTVSLRRSQDIPINVIHDFYEIIGKHDEYVSGWRDVSSFEIRDSVIYGESILRGTYRDMRAKATRYSRMQTWFLGGIFINHLVSGLDAAIAARFHNKKLYQTDVQWYDRVRLHSYLAFYHSEPYPTVVAYLPF